MSESVILDANFPPAPVADDAVGVCNDETNCLKTARKMVLEAVIDEYA